MGIDQSKIQDKLNSLRSSGGNNTSKLWKPDEGRQTIRLVPYRWQKDYPFLELRFHYELPGPNYLSPMSFDEEGGIGSEELVNRRDPIAEFAEEVRRNRGQEGYEMWKTLFPKRRTFAPVVVRGEESKGVRFWGFGKTIFENLLEKFADPDWGDLSDPQEGRDIKLKYIPRAQSDTNFPKTKINVSPKKTPLAEDESELKRYYDSQVRITDVFDVPTEDELQESLEDYIEGEDSEDEEEQPATGQSDNTDMEDEVTETDDFEDEFEDMFG
jgi:hypothetical protein